MSSHVDEETPLLPGKQATRYHGSSSLQLAEPLTLNVIYPFAPEVRSHIYLGQLINFRITKAHS